MAKPRNKTPWIKFYSVYHPLQQAEHVKAYSQWVFEEDRKLTTQIRDTKEPLSKVKREILEQVIAAFSKPIA